MNTLELLIEDIRKVWDPARFSLPRQPVVVAEISPEILLAPTEEVLDMPIKLPYLPFKIPFDNGVQEIIDICTAFEQSINPDWENYHCYLTINQGLVQPRLTQRNPGAHFDGMQGTRYPLKFRACHQYLVSSNLPTTYYVQSFNIADLKTDKHNWFKTFERQKDPRTAYQPKPFELTLQTAYCVHESTPAVIASPRTFVRIEFSLKQFNRIGNTRNPILDTGWNYEPQPIPIHLI